MTHRDSDHTDDGMRLDKWLWCARFYKTRSLAAAAIKSGKVRQEDGERIKPAKLVWPGEVYTLRNGPYTQTFTVRSLASQRRSAAEAALLYEETVQSLADRALLKEQLKMNAAMNPHPQGRPTKRERRKLIRFRSEG